MVGFSAAAAPALAAGQAQGLGQPDPSRHPGAGLAVDQAVHTLGQLPFPLRRMQLHQPLGGHQVQDPVAQELELLVVLHLARALAGAGVGQGPVQEGVVLEDVADAPLELGHRRLSTIRNGHFRTWKNRLSLASRNQVQGLKIETLSFHESRMMSALPTRFSAGT